MEEAEQHRSADHERREMRRLKNRLEGLIYTNERVFEQFGDLLGEAERKEIHETLLQARARRLDQRRAAELEAAMYDLNTISRASARTLMLQPLEAT